MTFTEMLVACLAVVLFFMTPVMIVWLVVRCIMRITDKRAEVMMSVIERNPDMDVQSLQFIGHKRPDERLLNKLCWGSVLSISGTAILIVTAVMCERIENIVSTVMCGAILLSVGVALLVVYICGKKLFKQESKEQ